ncbi:multiple sugar transport system permease protein [Enterococcus sp. PF1-24]|uniref:carbohydrate ABC transporter permease n=1 Tax=unclassified Enterococcus TaxID=2608891 RepID=UPI0024771849|nr:MULTISPECIES: sugar ABC transporter permease [unclassified Enterococcus]MDH6364005.1 multiple sugar transport system permease protein [Enterococcus sp. PFB1-1]MDH6401106.1 multiple sugar transport system permease protein [Enterococcus sp. PF1-24]
MKEKRLKVSPIFNLRNITMTLLVVYFAIFLIYPIYKAFAGSLHDWNPLIDKYDWVGFDNFKDVLTNNLFWSSMKNTFVFSFFSVLFRVILGLGLALLLNSKLTRFKSFFQGMFYMPTITPLVAVSFVWLWMFNPQFGLINKVFGLDINWLQNSKWAMPAIIIMTVWKDFGYATVIFLGGLMGLPEEVFEAADMDGANAWQRFTNITLPLLKPTTLFIVITSLISYFQAYIQILIMTKGGPGTSSYVISYLIYDEAFEKYNFGTASAMAIILFVIIAILTIIMFKITGEGELD